MNSIAKIVLAVAGALVALLVIAAVSLTTLVDPNDYKQEITSAVYDATGRDISFKGDISLTFFPWFGISLGEVSMTNPEGFPTETFASVAQAKASVKVLPLFYRKLEFSDVILKGVTLNLIENKAGKNNWTFKPPKEAEHKPKRRGSIIESPEPKATQTESIALAALLVESLSISDTNITYENLREGKKYSVADLTLNTSAFRAGKPFSLNVSGLATSQKPAVESPFQITIEATPSEDLQVIDVTNLHVVLEPKGEEIPGKQASIHLRSALTAHLNDRFVVVHGSELATYNTTLNLTGEVAYASELDVKGNMKLRTDYREVAKALGFSAPQPENDNSELQLSMQLKLIPDTIALSDIQGSLSGHPLDGDFLYNFGNTPQLRLRLAAEHINLDPYLALAELVTKNDKQTGKKKPAKKKKQKQSASSPIKGRTTNVERNAEQNLAKAFAPETLSKLNATVDIAIKKMVVKNIPITDIKMVGEGKSGVVTVYPLRFRVFEGDVNSTLKTDLRGTLPISSLKLTTDKMNLANITTTLTGTEYATGALFIDGSFSAYGMSKETVSRTLNGKATFNATKGTLQGLNLLPKGSLELFTGGARKTIESSLTAQPYDVIRGTLLAKNGRISNNDFIMQAAEMNAKGSGFANLASDSVHYKAEFKFDNVPPIPVVVSGKLSKPKYAVDMKRFLGSSIEDVTKSLLDKDSEEKNPLKRLEKGIRDLFK